MIQNSESENEDEITTTTIVTTTTTSISIPSASFATTSRNTPSPSPVHSSLVDSLPTPLSPTERPIRRVADGEFARVKIANELFHGSSKSLASLHSSMDSFDVHESPLVESLSVDDDDRMLYLLCARCIAFPFTAKYQLENVPPIPKLNAVALDKLRTALDECAEGGTVGDEAELTSWENKYAQSATFRASLRWYIANVLDSRCVRELCSRGGLSCRELENIFEAHVRTHVTERSQENETRYFTSTFAKLVESGSQLPHISYVLQTPVVGGSALSTADQEKLYTTFQKILNVSASKHKTLSRICQLGNLDEQEAVVRKELLRRKENIEKAVLQLGCSKQLQEMYRDAQSKFLSFLTSSLDSRAFAKSHPQTTTESVEPVLIKQDLRLSFKLHLTILEVELMTIQSNIKPVFCVFRLVNANESLTTNHELINLQTKSARFDQTAEFSTSSPLPQIQFDLHMESKGFIRESRVIATKIHTIASVSSSDTTEWINLEEKGTVIAKLKISVFTERPTNIKKCGYLYCKGNLMFKKWKRRYFVLLQLSSQYKFVLCSFKPMDTTPHKQVLLSGYTVEYLSKEEEAAIKEPGASVQYQLISDKGTIRIGCKDESERNGWVQWMTRAAGQENKLELPGEEKEMAKYAAIKDIVSVEVTELDHHKLFAKLFGMILNYQLKDTSFNRGLFSPSQLFVADEYCNRYCVRDCARHIMCMKQWLKVEEAGMSTWPLMMYSSFRFVQMHVAGKKPNDRSVFVLEEERDALVNIGYEIAELAARNIEGFKQVFPFGQPKDDLKVNIKLFNLVSSMQPGQSEKGVASNTVLVSCMERAALVNYQEIYHLFLTQHPGTVGSDDYSPLTPAHMLDLIQKCIDYMYELHDYYLDEFVECPLVLGDHIEAFWSFLLVDLQECLNMCDDVIAKIQLFHVINQYFCSQPTLKCCRFHTNILELFGPMVEEYIGCIGNSLTRDLAASLSAEDWLPSQQSGSSSAVDGCITALSSLDSFVAKLAWPVEEFSLRLQEKVFGIYCDQYVNMAKYTHERLISYLQQATLTVHTTLPVEVLCMLNTLLHLKAQVLSKYSLTQRSPGLAADSTPDALSVLSEIFLSAKTLIIEKICAPLLFLLAQLSLHDLTASFLAKLKLMMPGKVSCQDYRCYLNLTLHLFLENITLDDFNILVDWYDHQFQQIQSWLSTRPPFSLQNVQMESIFELVEIIRDSFENVTTISEAQLNSDAFNSTQDRMRMEKSRLQLLSSD